MNAPETVARMAMTAAERKRKQRARRAYDRCVVCVKRKAMAGKSVCRICNNAAKGRVRRSRELG